MMDYEPITKGVKEYLTRLVMSDQTKGELRALCDGIDAIHYSLEKENERLRNASEHGDDWIKLPVDADGVPIYIGDMLAEDGASPESVKSLMLDCDGWSVNFGLGWCVSKYHKWHHVTPDTWESIISDAMRAGRADVAVDVMPLIKRCKALAGEDE